MDPIEAKKIHRTIQSIYILSIILGCLGFLAAFSGLVGIAFQYRPNAYGPMSPGHELQDMKRMREELRAVNDRWRPYQILLIAIAIPVSAGLIFGGVKTMRREPAGVKLLLNALMAAAPYELANGIIGIMISRQVLAITTRSMQLVLDTGRPHGSPFLSGFPAIFAAISGAGVAFAACWMIAKFIFCIISFRYLRKPSVQPMLLAPPRPVPPPYNPAPPPNM
jgi:hypothetical protein